MHVFGHEHYAENLEDLACAGVPIHHPISGKTVGAVDLTCWRKDADPLLMTLAKTTAEQIQQALLADSGIRELELLPGVPADLPAHRRHRLRPEQRRGDDERPRPQRARPGRPVRAARRRPPSAGRRHATAPAAGRAAQRRQGPDVLPCRCAARAAGRRGRARAGCCPATRRGRRPAGSGAAAADVPARAGRLRSPLWLRACDEVERAYRRRRVARGGRRAGRPASSPCCARCSCAGSRSAGWWCWTRGGSDATGRPEPGWPASVRRALQEADSVVVRHVDRLDGPPAARRCPPSCRSARTGPRPHPPWVAVTTGPAPRRQGPGRLLRALPEHRRDPAAAPPHRGPAAGWCRSSSPGSVTAAS